MKYYKHKWVSCTEEKAEYDIYSFDGKDYKWIYNSIIEVPDNDGIGEVSDYFVDKLIEISVEEAFAEML